MASKEIFLSVVVAVALAGCNSTRMGSTGPSAAPIIHSNDIWLRTDGQSGRDNPALAAQFESDRAACTVQGGGLERSCMIKRGYIHVPPEKAAETLAQLRAKNPAVQQPPAQ
jgi:hypothetical protein